MGRMAKPLFRRFEFQKVVIAGHVWQQRSQFEGYGPHLDLSVFMTRPPLNQLEGLKKEPIQKADSAEVQQLFRECP